MVELKRVGFSGWEVDKYFLQSENCHSVLSNSGVLFMAHLFTPPNEEKETRRLCETLAFNAFYFPEPAARGPLIKSACGPGLPDSHRGV